MQMANIFKVSGEATRFGGCLGFLEVKADKKKGLSAQYAFTNEQSKVWPAHMRYLRMKKKKKLQKQLTLQHKGNTRNTKCPFFN